MKKGSRILAVVLGAVIFMTGCGSQNIPDEDVNKVQTESVEQKISLLQMMYSRQVQRNMRKLKWLIIRILLELVEY